MKNIEAANKPRTEQVENLDQFKEYWDFVENELLPMHEQLVTSVSKAVNKLNELVLSGALTNNELNSVRQSLGSDFDQSFAILTNQVYSEAKYGPVVAILGGMLKHSLSNFSATIFCTLDLIALDLKEKKSLKRLTGITDANEKFRNNERYKKDYLLKFPEQFVHDSQNSEDKLNEDGTRGYNSLDQGIKRDFGSVGYFLPDQLTKNTKLTVDIPQNILNEFLPYERIVYEIIKELMRNSIYALNGKAGQIKVSISKNEEAFILTVSDTGPGMFPEMSGKIFTKGATTREKGTGLGLYYIKEAVEKIIDGKINLESKLGYGTTVTIELPYK
ncbi:MAG: ATP-binding protein [Candidatus Vogelbacteria bacterium]|nr:ATP-binding protein [Candidatus Vogelbacteria bacterium]